MKRDMDLIRKILINLENQEGPIRASQLDIPETNKEDVIYHAVLMNDAGLIKGKDFTADNYPRVLDVFIERITWEGYDFLDSARNEKIWKEVVKTVGDKVGTVAFEVFKALLVEVSKKAMFINS